MAKGTLSAFLSFVLAMGLSPLGQVPQAYAAQPLQAVTLADDSELIDLSKATVVLEKTGVDFNPLWLNSENLEELENNISPKVVDITLDGQSLGDVNSFEIGLLDAFGDPAGTVPREAGEYTVVATGDQEKFTGEATTSFKLNPFILSKDNADAYAHPLTNDWPTDIAERGESQVFQIAYAGGNIPLMAEAAVLLGGEEDPVILLNPDQDYSYTPKGVSDLGPFNVTIRGKGYYSGSFTISNVGEVVQANLEDERFHSALVQSDDDVTYTGAPLDLASSYKLFHAGFDMRGSLSAAILVDAADYEISYSVPEGYTGELKDGKPFAAGTYLVTATAKGSAPYTGSVSTDLTVAPFDLSKDDADNPRVEIEVAPTAYTGAAQANGDVTVKFDGAPLTAGSDYTVTSSEKTAVGDYKDEVTVTGKGNFTGSKTATFNIVPAKLADAIDVADIADSPYSGAEITPTLSVSKKDAASSYDIANAYDVSYAVADSDGNTAKLGDNGKPLNAGDYIVTLTGKGSYVGSSIEKSFKVTPIALPEVTAEDAIFCGRELTPPLTFKNGDDEVELTAGIDYEIATPVKPYKDAGEYTVTVNGKGNYASSSKTAPFVIDKANLEDARFMLQYGKTWVSADRFSADDASAKPAVGVLLYDESSEDEPVSTIVSSGFDVKYLSAYGYLAIVVSAQASGNFTNAGKCYIPIDGISLKGATVSLGQNKFAYNGTDQYPDFEQITMKLSGSGTLMPGRDFGWVDLLDASGNSVERSVDAGTYTLVLGGSPYGGYAGMTTAQYTINPVDLGDKSISVSTIGDKPFTGQAYTDEPVVTLAYEDQDGEEGTYTLKKDIDYTLEYQDNVEAGKATVVVKAKGGNFTGSTSTSFNIAKDESLTDAAFEIKWADELATGSWDFTGSRIKPAIKVVSKSDPATAFAGTYSTVYSKNLDAGTATVTVIGTGSYKGRISKAFTIDPLDISKAKVTIPGKLTYNGKEQEPEPVVTYDVGNGKTYTLVPDVDYAVGYDKNVNAGKATATIVGLDNFEGGEGYVNATFDIAPATQTIKASAKTVTVGKTVELGASVVPSTTKLEYKSSSTAIATVNANGVVTGKKQGTVNITVTAPASKDGNYAKATKTVKVTVKNANTLKATYKSKTVTVKQAEVKSKAKSVANIKITAKGQGKITYANVSTTKALKAWKVDANKGTITVPAKTPKGTYAVAIQVKAAGNTTYDAGTSKVSFTIKVQ